MELTNEFRVDVPVDEAWDVLTDVERIAPCMPGAQLQEVAGDEYRGVVKIKVGPITAQYKGAARFVEKDVDAKRAVLRAEGRDTRGQGNANATITATLTADGSGTSVTVVTDLTVTGKVAQFGRGVLADVSSKLLGQFVDCLHNDLLAGATREAAPATTDAASNGRTRPPAASATDPAAAAAAESAAEARRIDSKPAAPVDLLDAAGVPVAKRAIPVVAAVLVILWFLRRGRKSGR